jgi:hypothetical protein
MLGRERSMVPDSWKRHYEDFALKRAAKWTVTSWGLVTYPLRVLPDFLIIGAQRSGTTSLYRHLILHPAVRGSVPAKGVHYFDTSFGESVAWYRAHFPTRLTGAYVRWRRRGEMVTGEGSPYYLFHPSAAERVGELLPEVKLIAMLRDPVDRAYSHYRQEVARGFEDLSFEEALDREGDRLAGESEKMLRDPLYVSVSHQHHSYLARGLYYEQIASWHTVFPPEQLLIVHSERFFADPPSELTRVHAFLGLPPWSPAEHRAHNARPGEPMSAQTRERLAQFYLLPNQRLFEYLGVDFGWNSQSPASAAKLGSDGGYVAVEPGGSELGT